MKSNHNPTVLDKINSLRFPQDVKELRKLSILELQIWISSLDPRLLVYMAQTEEYSKFIYWHYLLPLRFKRMMYRIKRMVGF